LDSKEEKKLLRLIKELTINKFYGKAIIVFENGKPKRIIKEESIKLN